MDNLTSSEHDVEDAPVIRKKCLLRILALLVAKQKDITVDDEWVQAEADLFREQFNLNDPDVTMRWLQRVGLDISEFSEIMYEFSVVRKLQIIFEKEIESRFEGHVKIDSVRTTRHGLNLFEERD
tara:strand:+ start:197 stop:571 length:375 start_codon:yes stop_codon:yes gene_type:complete